MTHSLPREYCERRFVRPSNFLLAWLGDRQVATFADFFLSFLLSLPPSLLAFCISSHFIVTLRVSAIDDHSDDETIFLSCCKALLTLSSLSFSVSLFSCPAISFIPYWHLSSRHGHHRALLRPCFARLVFFLSSGCIANTSLHLVLSALAHWSYLCNFHQLYTLSTIRSRTLC